MNKRSNNAKGISLIALIITIIVIIILAAIVMSRAGDMIDNANFAKFTSEFDDYDTAIQQDFSKRYAKYQISGKHITNAQIYYMIASGLELAEYEDPIPTGLVEDLGITSTLFNDLKGVEYYEITDDTNISDWTKQKSFYDPSEKHYVTDEGEVFILPGYKVKKDNTWYITSKNYYASASGITNGSSGSGEEPGGGSGNEEPATYLYSVANVGDYVAYTPQTASSTYNTNADNTGKTTSPTSQEIARETPTWQVLYKEGNTVYITATGGVNMSSANKIQLKGIKGYMRGPTELDNICNALYSNTDLGVTARSMTVEDLNKACNYTPSYTTRNAYYPYGTTVSGTITYGGNSYNKKACSNATHKFYVNSNEPITAIECEGTLNSDSIGSYYTPTADKPVYVTKTYYSYTPSEAVGNILGSGSGWLASPCVNVGNTYACFYVRIVSSGSLNRNDAAGSDGYSNSNSYGLRPLIPLTASIQVDTSVSGGGDGSSESPWQIK